MAPTALGKKNREARRRRDWQYRKGLLFDAAIEVANKYGIENASVELISEHAGFSKASIYYYFESKDAMYVELVKSAWQKVLEAATDVDPGATSAKRLRQAIRNQFILFNREGKLVDFMFRLARTPFIEQNMKKLDRIGRFEYFRFLLGLIRECQRDGSLPSDIPPAHLLNGIGGSMFGLSGLTGFNYPGHSIPTEEQVNRWLEHIFLDTRKA